MLRLILRRPVEFAVSNLSHYAVLRRISAHGYQKRLQETVYEGPNRSLLPTRPEKRQELSAFRESAPPASSEDKQAMREIKGFTKRREYSQAVSFFKQVAEPSQFLYGAVLNACARGFLFDDAMEIWHDMPPDYRSNVTYGAMLDLCRRMKRDQKGEYFMNEMLEAGITPNIITYRQMIGLYSKAGQPEKAMDIFKRVKETCLAEASEVSKQMTYLAVMSAFARDGDYKTVKELFEEMTGAGIPADHTHFNCLITSCSKHGYMDIAEAIIDLMPKWGLMPRLEDFTAYISVCRFDLPRCQAVYGKMQAAGIQPSFTTYMMLSHAHIAGGDNQSAQLFLEEAEKSSHRDDYALERLKLQLQSSSN